MYILAIDTSCDETAVAITQGRKVMANAIYSQILLHQKWGGVVPSIAKRAHEERIDFVVEEALKKYSRFATDPAASFPPASALGQWPVRAVGIPPTRATRRNVNSLKVNFLSAIKSIDYIAVTQGPGLAVALEVGIKKTKELAQKYNKKLIAVNHMEGHIYSCFVQNSKGNPKRDFSFPYLVLLVSGGHTELVIWKDHLNYEIIGKTLDDAGGEALDKAAKLLGLGYPGGTVIERLSEEVANQDKFRFPRPMQRSKDLNFSFSGLKTAFYYHLNKMTDEEKTVNIRFLASSFQEAVFDSLLQKTEMAVKQTGIRNLVMGGGVVANLYLRKRLRSMMAKHKGSIIFPSFKYLTGDNAAMIGVAAFYKAQKKLFVNDFDSLDRVPRLSLRVGQD